MFTGIVAALSALAGMVPAILNFFTLRENNAQQIRLEELRQQGEKEKIAGQVDIANSQADIRQADHIYEFASGSSGNRFVDALAVFVRPYITLVFFHLFLLIEVSLFIYGVNSGYDLAQLAQLLWDADTKSIFAAIMGFWFGNRMMTRGSQAMAATLAVSQSATTAKR
ncbi:hypothetical protein [uncultured Bradyrhizobium sp.]|uniref:hypothetical protein n=1 Tax=uncultured Bradyrhizobium sp. TaxID=199684 RepID=UPI0035CA1152